MVEPLNMGFTWTEDGKNIFNSDSPILAGFRMGYPLAFMQRKDMLNGPFEQPPDKSKSTLQSVFENSTIPPPGSWYTAKMVDMLWRYRGRRRWGS